MDRLREIEDRAKAPRLNKTAARSFVRNAIWEPSTSAAGATNEEKKAPSDEDGDEDAEPHRTTTALEGRRGKLCASTIEDTDAKLLHEHEERR